jgi:acetolactate synthase-1/2/3 large subunit
METQTKTQRQQAKETPVRITGAEAVVKCLLAEGVDLIYGYPGGAIMPVYDEFYKYDKELQHVLTRHEQGAIHAAQGYARVTDKVGVAIATSGPGATNLITGIADAQIDSTPLVCITGQVGSNLLGSDAFQETDIISISTPATKWNYQITRAEEIPGIFAKAFYIARSGRPGPVLIDITKDAQFGELDFEYSKCEKVRSYTPVPETDSETLIQAAELINKAKKPFVVWGQGITLGSAEEEFRAFIEKAGIPSASTLLGLSALPSDHELHVGMVGMHGNYAPNKLTNECDVFLGIGMRFDDRVTGSLDTYAKQAKIIHFEIDPSEVDKNVKSDVAVLGNVKNTLKEILPLIEKREHKNWMQEFHDLYDVEYEEVIKDQIHVNGNGLTMAETIMKLNELTGGDAVIVTDVGQHQMVASRYSKFNHGRSKITSGGLGTMGFALPAAIGAKMGAPDREVIAIMGDGGLQMNIQEFGTVLQTGVPVKVIVLNNQFLGMVRQWQELFFESRYASTVMTNPDFVKIADGYGIKARRISERDGLEPALKELLESETSFFLEVVVEMEENVFPMIPSGSSVSDIRLK